MIKRNKLFACLLFLALVPGISSVSYAEEDGYKETEDRTKGVDPVGKVEIKAKSVRLLIGASWGSGVLNFQGKDYTLKIKGMTAGGIGMVSVDATGDVFFLEDASQFTGTYTAGTIGITAVKGVGGAYFENKNGVVLKLRAKSTGLALSIGLGGFDVEFEEK